MASGGRHAYSYFGVGRGFSLNKAVFMAAFLAVATAAPVGAQELGLWQNRIGEGIAYGEPRQIEGLSATDPVAALPIAPRPPARAAAAVAPKPTVAPVAAKPAVKLPEVPAPAPVVTDLMLQGYNPDLPLPHPDIEGIGPGRRLSASPRPYVRGGDDGAVFGLTMPIAANRIPITSKNTRYGVGTGSPDIGFGNR